MASPVMLHLVLAQLITAALFLLILLPGNAEGKDENCSRVLSFKSSIEESQRTFVCPGEVVTYSCVTYGTQLRWNIDEHRIVFSQNDTAENTSRKEYNHTDQKTYWAILNRILDPQYDSGYRYCHSMLIVSPGQLASEDLTLKNCSPSECIPSSINCSAVPKGTMGPAIHQIAAVPMKPMPPICAYDSSKRWITIEVQMPESIDTVTDLDFYEIVFNNSGTTSTATRLMKLAGNGSTPWRSCYNDLPSRLFEGDHEISISLRVTAVDKCNQRSNATVNCTEAPDSMDCTTNTADTEILNLSSIGFLSIVIGVLIAAMMRAV